MARPKAKTKQIRVRLNRPDLLDVLRRKMRKTVAAGRMLAPTTELTDGNVVDFALVMANHTLDDNSLLIERDSFLDGLSESLNRHIEALAKMTEDERASMLEMMVLAKAKGGPVHSDTPLHAHAAARRAMHAEGEQ